MNSETRPIDWWLLVIEVLVLAIIAIEFFRIVLRERKTHKRLKKLYALMSKGQDLRDAVPSNDQVEMITAWERSVRAWIAETSDALTGYSPQAAAAFDHGSAKSGSFRHVHGALQDTYAILLKHIDNLRNVMEKPEVYY